MFERADFRSIRKICYISGMKEKIQTNDIQINTDVLKIIACICMLCDHAAIILFMPGDTTYEIMRRIGRTAFPIFCFLLTEGFIYSHSRKRYAGSLLLFALLSQPIYTMSISDSPERLNVMFTLLLGIILLQVLEQLSDLQSGIRFCLSGISIALICMIASYIHCSYEAIGILEITAFYIFRQKRVLALLFAYIVISLNILMGGAGLWAAPAFIFIYFYNGKQGKISKKYKYLFYFFYPGHLLALLLIGRLIFYIWYFSYVG